MKKNILVGQSGGPTAVINASLYGVIQEGLSHPDEIGAVYGMINGIEGFLSGHTINLSAELSKEDLELLRLTPAAYLGSCRYKLPENMDASVYPLLFEKFKAMNIGAVFYIGGNDSMDTADKLSRYAAMAKEDFVFFAPGIHTHRDRRKTHAYRQAERKLLSAVFPDGRNLPTGHSRCNTVLFAGTAGVLTERCNIAAK